MKAVKFMKKRRELERFQFPAGFSAAPVTEFQSGGGVFPGNKQIQIFYK